MNIIIAGSRHYTDYEQAEIFIRDCIARHPCAETLTILSGGCRGADQIGEQFAVIHGFAVQQFLPNWALFGKGAGPKRNRDMVNICDAVICFWDGKSRGTKSLIDYAKKQSKTIYIKQI